jgi:hypothetical protein
MFSCLPPTKNRLQLYRICFILLRFNTSIFSEPRQSHTTIAVIDRHTDGSFGLRALKQKLFVDGLSYLLQEIYGIENKNSEINKVCKILMVLISFK